MKLNRITRKFETYVEVDDTTYEKLKVSGVYFEVRGQEVFIQDKDKAKAELALTK